ncbi:Nucleoporin [Mycena chlorophos]|uniref:Nucleoporin n=1 Tax=Mycena chlorophos TaxID=658473 RepID=A0A8H6VQ90_MYCCL|nr:Nucleoporin [Mycena chlorophos]
MVDFAAALENASNVLNAEFAKDAQAVPDLGDTLTAPGGQASASYSVFPNDTRFSNSTTAIDHTKPCYYYYYHKLFLWDYIEGQEISSFVDQPDVITNVALVKPKQGLFIDEINSILVICTPVGSKRREIKLYATDFTVPTDVEMTSVAGTADGRIFMAGAQDGSLYELHYQETESWFGKRVQLINHSVGGMSSLLPRFSMSSSDYRIVSVVSDLSRNCFYTLNGKSNISIYRPDGEKSLQHVQTISNISKLAQDKAPGSPAITPATFTIVGLHVVEPAELRSGIQLLAITSNGVRLYFSPSGGFGYSSYVSGSATGSRQLYLVHVRLPPPNLIHPDEHTQPYRQPNSCYVDGVTIAAQPGDADATDYILCMSPDLTQIGATGQLNPQQAPIPQVMHYGSAPMSTRPPLTEHATLLSIPRRTWAMAPVIRPAPPSPPTGTPAPTVFNELAAQFSSHPRQFMILTNVGLTFLVKRRALDYLKADIEELQLEGNVQPLMEFRDSFGRDQTCAMLLGLASGNTFLDPTNPSSSTLSAVSPDMVAVAKQVFYDFGERPTWTERIIYGADNQGTATFSGRREGLALYLARLVWPIWKSKITVVGPSGQQRSTIPDSILDSIQKNVFSLKDFLDKNPHLFQSSPTDAGNARTGAGEQEAWKAEQTSVAELLMLATRTIEAVAFVLLLNDYKLGELVAKCDAETQKLIAGLTYQDLITTQNGMTISRALVNVIIDQQIGQQLSVDNISEILQHRCGSFCSTDDVMLYKAKENVRKAAETRSPTERQKWLAESLRLFIEGARILEFDKL